MALLTFGSLALFALLGAARAMPGRSALERALVASVLWIASAIAVVEILSLFHAIDPWPFAASCVAIGALAAALAGRASWALLLADVRALGAVVRRAARAPSSLAIVCVAFVALLLPILAGTLLGPWSWDALALHLPIVEDALSAGTLRWVPSPGDAVSAHPRLVDVLFVAVRLSFVDDTLVDLGQVPFVLPAVLAVALLARIGGAPTGRALPLASLFCALPVVALDLGHTDVAVAFAALALAGVALASVPVPTGTTMLGSALALGLALGADVAATPLVAVGLALLLVRAHREERLGEGLLAAALAFAIGGWKYVESLARTGGLASASRAPPAPIAPIGGALESALLGWISPWSDPPAYDVRSIGFGPLFTFALLPLAAAVLLLGWRSSSLRARLGPVAMPLALLAVAGLVTPGATSARETIVVAAASLVLAIAVTERASAAWRPLGHVALGALAAFGVFAATPAFTAGGPPLSSFLGRSRAIRETLVGLDPFEAQWRDARERLGAGEAFGYDESYALAGRLAPSDGRGRVVFLSAPSLEPEALVSRARTERLRMIVLGEATGGAAAARTRPAFFTEAFACPGEHEACAVFEVDLEALR